MIFLVLRDFRDFQDSSVASLLQTGVHPVVKSLRKILFCCVFYPALPSLLVFRLFLYCGGLLALVEFFQGLWPRFKRDESLSSCLVSSVFSELRFFFLGVPCGSGSFLFSVQWGTGFYWLTASTSRAPWELVAGRRVLSCSFWPCGRQLVDGFCSLGSPFLRKKIFVFPCQGFFLASPQRARSFFLLSAIWLQVQFESNPRTDFGILRCLCSFARLFFISQFGYLKLSCSPLVPLF